MPNIERTVRESLKTIAKKLGLQPELFPTKEEAIIIGASAGFLNGKGSPDTIIINLPPTEEIPPDAPTAHTENREEETGDSS